MFDIKQPDAFALQTAEKINSIGSEIKQFLTTSVATGFRELFYDGESVRAKSDIRRILAAFENPAELFQRHEATVAYLRAQYPDCLTDEQCVPPVAYTINQNGSVTIPD